MSILFDNPPPAIGCGDPGDQIDFGCRFEGGFLHKVFADASADPAVFTASGWIKRHGLTASKLSGVYNILDADPRETDGTFLAFDASTHQFFVGHYVAGAYVWGKKTSGVFRDPAGWLHFHVIVNTHALVAEDRVKVWIDGVQSTLSGVSPTKDSVTYMGTATVHTIGASDATAINTVDSSIAALFLFPGAERDVSKFGYFNTDGVWVPKKYNGPYGTNGFHLDFADPLELGKDVSGNGNHFTSFGLTADNEVTDTPTNNIACLNPLSPGASACLKAGNTLIDGLVNQTNEAACTQIIPPDASGRWTARLRIEVYGESADDRSGTYTCLETGTSYSFKNLSSQELIFRPGDISIGYINQGDEIDFTFDFDADTIELVRNGVLLHTVPNANLAQGHWLYSAKAESTLNRTPADISVWFDAVEGEEFSAARLPCPEILNPDDYFTTRQPIGGGDITDLPWDPTVHKTLCMSKRRDSETDWRASDTVRGDNLAWSSNVGGLETACSLSFTPGGIAAGADTEYQGSRIDYFWRASPKSGFDIVDFTHVNGTPTTIAHAAGGVIEFALVVPLDGGDIRIYHHEKPNDYAILNDTGYGTDAGWLSSTAVNITHAATRPSGRYIAYVWRGVSQFSSFSKYPGNGLADGSFVPADFLPRCILLRRATSGVSSRTVLDDADRYDGNPSGASLYMDGTETEGTGSNPVDLVSNGAKLRVAGTVVNQSGIDHLFGAWAKTPGKFARAR